MLLEKLMFVFQLKPSLNSLLTKSKPKSKAKPKTKTRAKTAEVKGKGVTPPSED